MLVFLGQQILHSRVLHCQKQAGEIAPYLKYHIINNYLCILFFQ